MDTRPGWVENPMDHGPHDSFEAMLGFLAQHPEAVLGERHCPSGHPQDELGLCLIGDEYGMHRLRRTGTRCVDCFRPVDVWRIS